MSEATRKQDDKVGGTNLINRETRSGAAAPLFYYRVQISYKGTAFHGWQAQSTGPDDPKYPTVQGSILQVLRRIADYRDCSISGASRTDAGVHAAGQIGKITIPIDIDPDKLLLGMNSLLTGAVRIVACERCPASFNPKSNSLGKEYHYYFTSSAVPSPIVSDIIAHVRGPLSTPEMQSGCSLFVGEHDFYNYCPRSSLTGSSVRTITRCHMQRLNSPLYAPGTYRIEVTGNGFLKYMIRYIVGVLLDLGRGNVNAAQITDSLHVHRDEKLSAKVKAHGLHLISISY